MVASKEEVCVFIVCSMYFFSGGIDGLKWRFVLGSVLSNDQLNNFRHWLVGKYCDTGMKVISQQCRHTMIFCFIFQKLFGYIFDVLLFEAVVYFLMDMLHIDYELVCFSTTHILWLIPALTMCCYMYMYNA